MACMGDSVFRRLQSPIKPPAFRRGWFSCVALLAGLTFVGCGPQDSELSINRTQQAIAIHDWDVEDVSPPFLLDLYTSGNLCLQSDGYGNDVKYTTCPYPIPVDEDFDEPEEVEDFIDNNSDLVWEAIVNDKDEVGDEGWVYTYLIRLRDTDYCLEATGSSSNVKLGSCPGSIPTGSSEFLFNDADDALGNSRSPNNRSELVNYYGYLVPTGGKWETTNFSVTLWVRYLAPSIQTGPSTWDNCDWGEPLCIWP